MTTKRLAILVFVVTLGLSGVFLLPKSAALPFGVNLNLPATINDWWGKDEEVSKKERETLGAGTEFARKSYRNHLHETMPGYTLLASMVLSGHDMSNSIHRPERCLNAQGWSVLDSERTTIQVDKKGTFDVTRLLNRRVVTDEFGKPRLKDGLPLYESAYTYYWFVGERRVTATHWGRFFQDNQDRLLRGLNQCWAFITVTGLISRGTSAEPDVRLRVEVDKTLRQFITELAPHIHKADLIYQ